MRIRAKLAAAAVLAVAVLMLIPGVASAHDEKERWPVRLGDRILRHRTRAYVGFPNAVFLDLFEKDDKPVIDLGDALTVMVGFGDQTIRCRWSRSSSRTRNAGSVSSVFVPSQAGATRSAIRHDRRREVRSLADVRAQDVRRGARRLAGRRSRRSRLRRTRTWRPAYSKSRTARRRPSRPRRPRRTDAQAAADSAKTVGIIAVIVGSDRVDRRCRRALRVEEEGVTHCWRTGEPRTNRSR